MGIRILTSSWTQRQLPFLLAAGLIGGFWPNLLRALGAGVILAIATGLFFILLIWRGSVPTFLRAWNRWLGLFAFAAALLGILAFFNPGDGIPPRGVLSGWIRGHGDYQG
jgi:hypothetical protein